MYVSLAVGESNAREGERRPHVRSTDARERKNRGSKQSNA
eukprot:COSAG06_NODE_62966_length_263_cov_1.237805_1_plen_39_part_10